MFYYLSILDEPNIHISGSTEDESTTDEAPQGEGKQGMLEEGAKDVRNNEKKEDESEQVKDSVSESVESLEGSTDEEDLFGEYMLDV